MTSIARSSVVSLTVLLGGWLAWSSVGSAGTPAPPAPARAPVGAVVPRVAVVVTPPGSGTSSLYFASAAGSAGSARSPSRALATVRHLRDGSVRAALLPHGSTVLVSAPVTPGRDPSFDGGLFALRPDAGAQPLCAGLVHASSPAVTDDGRVLVSRGEAGPVSPESSTMRVDALSVDEVDLGTGALRPVHAYSGYLAYLAGTFHDEVLLYRVGPGVADVVGVQLDSGTVRSVVPTLVPFARDFSVDAERGVLVYRNRHETDAHRWVVDEVDLASGRARRLFAGASFALAPHAWPGGGVALNPEGRGLTLLESRDPVAAPRGAGIDHVRAVDEGGRWVALLHTVPDALGVPVVLDRTTGEAWGLDVPTGADVAIAGFVAPEVTP